jgi:ABC-2 type transport system permease protein
MEIYSPEYNAATDLTHQAMQHTIEWFNQHIGTYPGDALRLVMVPDLGPTGYALPQLILINHRVGVRAFAAPQAGFSQVYRRTVHEVAHQWFGHGLGNGVPGDSAFLVESLAKYAELVIIEQHFGVDAMQALVEFERERYSRAHAGSRSEQKNLIDADESYDQYSRATLVFAKLRQEVGDTVLVATIHQLWQQHRYPAKPASAMDFVRALQANSPPSAQPLIHTLLLELDTSQLSE